MAAVIRIEVQTSGSVDGLKKDLQDVGHAAEESGHGFSAMQEIATGALRAVGEGLVGLAVKGFGALHDAVADGINDAKQTAVLNAQTAAVLVSTGNAAGTSAQHVSDYASALSDAAGKSLFGDDQIQQSENLLLTFTNIKGASLDAATAISVDMAQALGGAPKDSAIQLGKALNDPIKGITALTRVGVTFTQEQKDQIKAMQEQGDTAGAQAVILAELNKEFGGSAEAAAKATGGWSELNGRLGEAKEALGTALLPLLSQLAGFLLANVMPAIEIGAEKFGKLVAMFTTGAEGGGLIGGITNALFYLEQFAPVFGVVGDAINTVADAFHEAGGFTLGLGAAINGLVFQFTGLSTTAGFLVTDVLDKLVAAFSNPQQAIIGLIATLDQVSPMFAILHGVIETVMPSIQLIVTQVFGIISSFMRENGATMLADVKQIWEGIQNVIHSVLPPIQQIVNAVFGAIAQFLQAHGAEITAFLKEAWDQIAAIIKIAIALIQATIVPALQAIAAFIAAHGTEIQALLTNTWNAIKAVIDIALSLIRGILQAALQAINGDWAGAWNTIQTMCARVVQDLVTIIQSGIGNIVTMFGGLATQVMDVLNALPGQAASIGNDIVQGIIHGIEGAAGALFDSLKNLASNALQAAKDALSSHSPSQVFADEVGEPIVQGIMVGIEGMMPALTMTIESVADYIVEHTKKVTKKVKEDAANLQDELMTQAEGISGKIAGVMADAFSGTASLERAKARAIDMLKDISKAQVDAVQTQLADAATKAAGFGDPKQGAAFFKMRADQIMELAKLSDQIDKSKDEAAKARLIEQYNLIGKAQQAELDAFGSKTTNSPAEGLMAQIQAIISKVPMSQFDDPTGALGQLFNALPQISALVTGNPQVSSSMYNSSQFTYAPTINTSGGVHPPMDMALATSLAGV